MSYKSILIHVDHPRGMEARIEAAVRLAHAGDAHLTGVAFTGVSRFMHDIVASDADNPAVRPHLQILRDRAELALQHFDEIARRAGAVAIARRSCDDEAIVGLARMSRCSDLCVMGRSGPSPEDAASGQSLCADVALASGTPVIVLPEQGAPATLGQSVLVGWNDSRESARALHLALPLLRRARRVDVAIFNQPQSTDELRAYLALQRIDARILQEETPSDPGDALLALAGSLGADLLVMGCYGHPRLRELLLGGATRSVLRAARIPVLLAG